MNQSNIFKPKPYSFNDYIINNVVDRDVDYLIYKIDMDINSPIKCRAIFDICINVSDDNYGEVVLSHFKEISTNNIIDLCDVKFISPTREIDISNVNDISNLNLNKIVNHIKNILNKR